MPYEIFSELTQYVGFSTVDADNLRALHPIVAPQIGRVVERFYAEILRHPGARRVLVGGNEQVERLKGHLAAWIERLFSGVYDDAYVQSRATIGHIHVRVGLPQHYSIAAIDVIRQELDEIVHEAGLANASKKLHSLSKLLSIETAIMLETYKNGYSERIRRAEQEAMKERLSQAEHLAEIGKLAASLAHEIKNPLAGISGAIQVLRDDLPADDPRRGVLVEVLRQINRLDGTVKDLLTYARPHPPRFKMCDLCSVIARVAALLGQEPAFKRVRLQYAECADVAPIEADEHQIEQVLVNLLLNAAHASNPDDVVRLRVSAEPDEIALLVEDQGQGMDDELCQKALEPFFTTKARGTGLGLPICRRIVDAHAGSMHIHSQSGQGTTVEVRLPRRQSRPNS